MWLIFIVFCLFAWLTNLPGALRIRCSIYAIFGCIILSHIVYAYPIIRFELRTIRSVTCIHPATHWKRTTWYTRHFPLSCKGNTLMTLLWSEMKGLQVIIQTQRKTIFNRIFTYVWNFWCILWIIYVYIIFTYEKTSSINDLAV